MLNLPNFTPTLDKYAISISAICAIHCMSLPLLLGVFPGLSSLIFGQEVFHVFLLWFVIPLSVISLSLGYKQHNNRLVALFGITGLSFMIIAAAFGHDVLGEVGEQIATLIGALSVATGHFINYKCCTNLDCDHEVAP